LEREATCAIVVGAVSVGNAYTVLRSGAVVGSDFGDKITECVNRVVSSCERD
jgi:hypothetical protein